MSVKLRNSIKELKKRRRKKRTSESLSMMTQAFLYLLKFQIYNSRVLLDRLIIYLILLLQKQLLMKEMCKEEEEIVDLEFT